MTISRITFNAYAELRIHKFTTYFVNPPQSAPQAYRFSFGYRLSIYISVGVYVALAVGTLYVGLIDRTSPNPNAIWIIGLAGLFVLGGLYQLRIALRLVEIVTLTDTHITQRLANGAQLTLRWDEIVAFRERRFLGRVELVSKEPKPILRLEYQLHGFAELLAEVEQRLAARNVHRK